MAKTTVSGMKVTDSLAALFDEAEAQGFRIEGKSPTSVTVYPADSRYGPFIVSERGDSGTVHIAHLRTAFRNAGLRLAEPDPELSSPTGDDPSLDSLLEMLTGTVKVWRANDTGAAADVAEALAMCTELEQENQTLRDQVRQQEESNRLLRDSNTTLGGMLAEVTRERDALQAKLDGLRSAFGAALS